MTQREFALLLLPEPKFSVAPPSEWALINMPMYVAALDEPVTLTTTLLGTEVTVVATPISWTWDFGDGHTLTTTKPGRPYPNADHSHTYETPGDYTLRVTTTWSGTFQTPTTGPTPIDGTTTTTATHGPIRLLELTNSLHPPIGS